MQISIKLKTEHFSIENFHCLRYKEQTHRNAYTHTHRLNVFAKCSNRMVKNENGFRPALGIVCYGYRIGCGCVGMDAYLDGRIWQNRSWPVVSSSLAWSLSSLRRFIDEYRLNILKGLTFFALATSHTRTIIFRPLLYTVLIVLYTNIDTDRGGGDS